MAALLAAPAVLCVIAIIWRPATGAYLLLATTPVLAGLARGVIPLRPHEMLLLVVIVALGLRSTLLMLCRRYCLPRFDRIDIAMLLLAATSSILPLATCLARGVTLTQDDVLYALVFAKYYALYRVFRSTITVRWSRLFGQFGGSVKLIPVC